jgi:hypothetical protein
LPTLELHCGTWPARWRGCGRRGVGSFFVCGPWGVLGASMSMPYAGATMHRGCRVGFWRLCATNLMLGCGCRVVWLDVASDHLRSKISRWPSGKMSHSTTEGSAPSGRQTLRAPTAEHAPLRSRVLRLGTVHRIRVVGSLSDGLFALFALSSCHA